MLGIETIVRAEHSLGVEGVPVVIYQNWVQKLRRAHFPLLPRDVADDTPGVVSKLKKSPAILVLILELRKSSPMSHAMRSLSPLQSSIQSARPQSLA